MLKRTQILASAAIAVCMALPAFAEDNPSADTVVATVNGTDITLGHMIVVRSSLPEQYQQLPDDVLFQGILDQLIQQSVLAELKGDPVSKRVELALENERRSLMAAEQIDTVLGEAITEAAVLAAYDARYSSAEQETEFDASHILVESEEEAKSLVVALEGGADFAELAKEKSTGPSGPRGGALGWFGKGMMVPEFEQAVEGMEAGGISAPVQTQFGWHVIKLNNVRPKDAPKLEDVRAELENEISQKAVEEHIDMLTNAAEIERMTPSDINSALIKNLTLLEE